MTVQEFSGYSLDTQYQMLQQRGVFLMTRSTQYVWVVLFAFYDFYVEVAQAQDNGKIRFIRGFADTKGLDPYLTQININPILNS
jgi:hypothetical protein